MLLVESCTSVWIWLKNNLCNKKKSGKDFLDIRYSWSGERDHVIKLFFEIWRGKLIEKNVIQKTKNMCKVELGATWAFHEIRKYGHACVVQIWTLCRYFGDGEAYLIALVWNQDKEYFIFSFRKPRVEIRHTTRNALRFGGTGERKLFNGNGVSLHYVPRFPLPTLLCAGYSVKLKKICTDFLLIMYDYDNCTTWGQENDMVEKLLSHSFNILTGN